MFTAFNLFYADFSCVMKLFQSRWNHSENVFLWFGEKNIKALESKKIPGDSSKNTVSINIYCFSANPDIIPEARDFRHFQKFLQQGKGPAICASDYRRWRENFPHSRVTIYYSRECSIRIPPNKRKLDYRIRGAEDSDEYN